MVAFSPDFPRKPEPDQRWLSGGTAERERVARGMDGGMIIAEEGGWGGVQRESRGLASPLQHWALSPTAGCGPTWVVKGGSLYGGRDRWYRRV